MEQDWKYTVPRLMFSSVQSLSHVWLFATPWTAAGQDSLSITNSQSLLKLIPSSWWCHPTIREGTNTSFPQWISLPTSPISSAWNQNCWRDFSPRKSPRKLKFIIYKGFPGGSDGKESVCNEGNQDSIPGSDRSPGVRDGNPLQYSCLENPRGAWRATVHGVAKWELILSF